MKVSDNNGAMTSQSFVIEVKEMPAANRTPTADAGPDKTASVGAPVTLDGSNSSDPDGDSLAYAWSLVSRPNGSNASLSDPSAVNPSFVVDLPGTYNLELVVDDGMYSSAPDSVTVNTANSKPVADAGPDQTPRVTETVTLDGSKSSDVDGNTLTFKWSLTSKPAGSSAALSDPAAVKPTFLVDEPGTYVAQLIVHDGMENSDPDTATIKATPNQPPTITSSPVTTATAGSLYSYQVTATDPEGDAVTFSLVAAPTGITIDATTGLIQWTPTEAQVGSHTVTVRAADRCGYAEQSFTHVAG